MRLSFFVSSIFVCLFSGRCWFSFFARAHKKTNNPFKENANHTKSEYVLIYEENGCSIIWLDSEFQAIDSLGVTFTIWHIIPSIYESNFLLLYSIHIPLVFNHQTTGTTCVNNRLVCSMPSFIVGRASKQLTKRSKRGNIANLK